MSILGRQTNEEAFHVNNATTQKGLDIKSDKEEDGCRP